MALDEGSALAGGDLAVLAGYFLLTGVILVGVSRHQAKAAQGGSSTESYFLAERSVSWWAVAASLFASNIGSEHFVGLAGGAARSGVAMGWYEVGAIPVLLITGLFFLPTYLSSKVQTTPDYLHKRYSLYCRTVMVSVSLLIYVFARISATLYAGELIVTKLVAVNKLVAVILLVTFTALYTVLGGLEAVIYTEALQTAVLLIGGSMMLFYALDAVDGFDGLVTSLQRMDDVDEDFLHFFRPSSDPTVPWSGFIFGYYVFVPWYFGVDQVIVQRALAAKDVAHGQLGCSVAAVLKFIPFFIMVVPGLCARVLIAERLPDQAKDYDYDEAYPWMVVNVIPPNMRGLIVASMLSSLMSALASVFNSSGTLFALNIWKQIYPTASEARLVLVGRITVVVLAVLSLFWLPMMSVLGKSLFTIINKPPAYLAPPILCLYVWGMLSTLPNRRAGNYTLTFGIILGGMRFTLEVLEDVMEVKMFGMFTSINFLHFAAISFWVYTAMLFSLSLFFREGKLAGFDGEDDDSSSEKRTFDRNLLFRTSLFDELMSNNAHPDRDLSERLHDGQSPRAERAHSRSLSFGDEDDLQPLGGRREQADGAEGEFTDLALQDAPSDSASPRAPTPPSSVVPEGEQDAAQRGGASRHEPPQGRLRQQHGSHPAEPTWFGKRTILTLSGVIFAVWLTQVILLA